MIDDAAVRPLPSILPLTFEEAQTPDQHNRIIEDIRFAATEALAPCNKMFEAVGMEPVVLPTQRRFINGMDTHANEDGNQNTQLESASPF